MKTLRNLTGILLIVFVIASTKAEIHFPGIIGSGQKESLNRTQLQQEFPNGQIAAVVNLPEIEIVSTSLLSNIYQGNSYNGKWLIKANLPMIEIFASRPVSNKLPAFVNNGEIIGISELPLIEIVSEFPLDRMVAGTSAKNVNMAVVNLPIISITSASQIVPLAAAASNEPIQIITENLSTDYLPSHFAALIFNKGIWNPLTFDNNNTTWFYVTLKKCGLNLDGNQICEIVSQRRINSEDLFFTNVTTGSKH